MRLESHIGKGFRTVSHHFIKNYREFTRMEKFTAMKTE